GSGIRNNFTLPSLLGLQLHQGVFGPLVEDPSRLARKIVLPNQRRLNLPHAICRYLLLSAAFPASARLMRLLPVPSMRRLACCLRMRICTFRAGCSRRQRQEQRQRCDEDKLSLWGLQKVTSKKDRALDPIRILRSNGCHSLP